jgi:hypothetical protein
MNDYLAPAFCPLFVYMYDRLDVLVKDPSTSTVAPNKVIALSLVKSHVNNSSSLFVQSLLRIQVLQLLPMMHALRIIPTILIHSTLA